MELAGGFFYNLHCVKIKLLKLCGMKIQFKMLKFFALHFFFILDISMYIIFLKECQTKLLQKMTTYTSFHPIFHTIILFFYFTVLGKPQ